MTRCNKMILMQSWTSHKSACSGEIYDCENCDYKTKHKAELRKHISKGHSIQCDICDRYFKTKLKLTNHRASAHEKLKCEHSDCERTFSSVKTLNAHLMLKHSSADKFNCDHCEFSSISEAAFRRHGDVHERRKIMRWSCVKCSFESHFKHEMLNHIKQNHPTRHLINDNILNKWYELNRGSNRCLQDLMVPLREEWGKKTVRPHAKKILSEKLNRFQEFVCAEPHTFENPKQDAHFSIQRTAVAFTPNVIAVFEEVCRQRKIQNPVPVFGSDGGAKRTVYGLQGIYSSIGYFVSFWDLHTGSFLILVAKYLPIASKFTALVTF